MRHSNKAKDQPPSRGGVKPALKAPAKEKKQEQRLGGGGWKWRVEADGRPWEVPGGPDRRQPQHTGPAGPLGHIPPVHGPTYDCPGTYMRPDLAVMGSNRLAAASPAHPRIGVM